MRHLMLIVTVLVTTSQINIAHAQSSSSSKSKTGTRLMANEGDTVWVIVNHIKADKRQDFERFVHEIFWPMAKKLKAEDQRLFRQTRVLHPVAAENRNYFYDQ